jgi:hypothetical protein
MRPVATLAFMVIAARFKMMKKVRVRVCVLWTPSLSLVWMIPSSFEFPDDVSGIF